MGRATPVLELHGLLPRPVRVEHRARGDGALAPGSLDGVLRLLWADPRDDDLLLGFFNAFLGMEAGRTNDDLDLDLVRLVKSFWI